MLIAHNRYQQAGGEDRVVEAEATLLRSAGHAVIRYDRHNIEATTTPKPALLTDTVWSTRSAREVGALISEFRPDVLHVHNTFFRMSASVHWAAHRAGVAVVQTLHNFRLVCPQATLLRAQRPCEACIGKVPWRAVVHGCYRQSRGQSAVAALALQTNRIIGTWRDATDLYITLDSSCHERFVRGGLPAERLRVKPNFVSDPQPDSPSQGDTFLYVGRLSSEKGVGVLRKAMARAERARLLVVGDGPLRDDLAQAERITTIGLRPPDEVVAAMRRARALVIPSIGPEMFGLVAIEAYASGLPVIASRSGALANIVEHGRTGLLVPPGDDAALADALAWAEHHPEEMATMGAAARERYLRLYTPETNLAVLEQIYREAVALRRSSAAGQRR